ncbi:uncharacterized protein JCM6883_006431 [Sporobolomyces salmoneus]|uniref:uncharacterized protein n=1 Tax=Sporobolomyces salmoneus TaxID=183962 RepID=UPI00317A897E
MSAFAFPSLEVLGLCDIAFGTIPLALPTFPSLRHVILDRLEEHTLAVLTGLLASLDSIILRPDHFLEARSAIGPEFPVDKVLVNLPWQWGSDEAEEEFVVNLRLLAPDLRSTHSGALQEIVDDYTSLFEEDAQFYPRLETIYLPLVDSLAGNHDREESQAGLERLASACRKRKVEVVFEEQHWAIDCECQVSEDFMRRMTKKRIMRENGET